MFIYVLMLAVFSTGALVWQKANRTGKPGLSFYAAVILAVLIVGLRWRIGPDWDTYSLIYANAGRMRFSTAYAQSDPDFYLLDWLLNYFDAPYWTSNLAVAVIFLFGLQRFCKTLPNPWLAMTVAAPFLIIVVGMNLARQTAAMGFVFLALTNVGTKPLWKSIGWALVGAMFHASAAIVALFIGFSYTKNRLVAFGIMLFGIIPAYFLLSNSFDEYLDRYTTQTIDSGGVYFRLAINAIPAVVLLILRKRGIVPSEEYVLWRNFALISILLIFLPPFVQSTTSIDRMSIYAIPMQLMVLSAFPHVMSKAGDRAVNTGVIILYSALTLFVYFGFGTHARYFVPYHWVLGA